MSGPEPVVTITLTEYNRLVAQSKQNREAMNAAIDRLLESWARALEDGRVRGFTPEAMLTTLRALKIGQQPLPSAGVASRG